jgi:uncharacterized membrane protein
MPDPHPTSAQPILDAERALANRARTRRRSPLPVPNEVHDQARTVGERVADRVAKLAGSWTFILVFLAVLGAWMAWNGLRRDEAFDPYPFILLNLALSCVAALQAPVIMMSQNRQAARDRRQADLDFEINVCAEAELREELDALRRHQWDALVALQHEQLDLLRRLTESRPHG